MAKTGNAIGLTPGEIQGIQAPGVAINPQLFYAATRRMRFGQATRRSIAGLGSSDPMTLRQTGIISALEIRVSGTLEVGTADVTTMSQNWPHNLLKSAKLSANGQSNLINVRGLTLKAHEFASNPKLCDRSVSHYAGATAYTNGTLSLASEDWGTGTTYVLGPRHTPGGTDTYSIDLTYIVPVAADPVSLIGSLFAQTTATNLALELQWAEQSDLLTIGSAVLTWDLYYEVTTVAYSIPQINGTFVVPDVTTFHQFAETGEGGLTSGENEVRLSGVGPGRKLLRVIGQVQSNSAPLAVNSTNYSGFAWRYGGNDTPEAWMNGQGLRYLNERQTGCDIGSPVWGLFMFDFASEHALRDVVDEGQTSDLRIMFNLASTPTSGRVQVAQETLFTASVGA